MWEVREKYKGKVLHSLNELSSEQIKDIKEQVPDMFEKYFVEK